MRLVRVSLNSSSRPVCAIAHQEPGPMTTDVGETEGLSHIASTTGHGVWVPAQGRDDEELFFHQRTFRIGRTERILSGDLRQDLVIVPRIFRLFRRFDL